MQKKKPDPDRRSRGETKPYQPPKIHRALSGQGLGIRVETAAGLVSLLLDKKAGCTPEDVEELIALMAKEVREHFGTGGILNHLRHLEGQ